MINSVSFSPHSAKRPSEALHRHRADICRVVALHRAGTARVLGCVIHGLDTEQSALDLLIDPAADARLFDTGAIRREHRLLLGVNVDVLAPGGLADEFRTTVVEEARPVSASRSNH